MGTSMSEIAGASFERLAVRHIKRLRRIDRQRIGGGGVKVYFLLIVKEKPTADLMTAVLSKFSGGVGSLKIQVAQVGSMPLIYYALFKRTCS